MASTISPNMNLIIPGVGTEAGPTYAFDINSSLTLIDQHDHTPGKGVQIVTAALNIDADLSLNDFSLTNATTIVFTPSSSASTTPQSLSVAPGGESPQQQDLWYTPNTGAPIQITKNGAVNVVASSIDGESYASGTFFWTQAQDALPTTPANFDIGSVTIRPNTALTTLGVTLSPASAISSQYSIQLPLIPSVKNLVTLDTSGNMVADTNVDNSSIEIVSNTIRVKAQGITAAMVLNNTLTTNQISLTAGITQGQLADAALAWRNQIITLSSTPAFNVLVATTANITLSGTQTIDGVGVVATNIVLVKNQTTSANNGVYNVAAGAWTRNTSYDTFTELNYAGVHVTSGTTNGNTNWFQNRVLTSLSDAQVWSKSSTVEFIVPTGVNQLLVYGIGGGGGGGGSGGNAAAGNGAGTGAGGGGAAGLPVLTTIPVVAGSSMTVTVGFGGPGGAGGAGGGVNTGGNGTAGQPSIIQDATTNYTFAFMGGNGGSGGTGTQTSLPVGVGGAAGLAVSTTGDGYTTATGFTGSLVVNGGTGGNGGNVAGTNAQNGANSYASIYGRAGSGGPLGAAAGAGGGGGGGGGGAPGLGALAGALGGTGFSNSGPTPATDGAPGTGYGGGGAGGGGVGGNTNSAGKAGGSGAAGAIIIYYLKGGA